MSLSTRLSNNEMNERFGSDIKKEDGFTRHNYRPTTGPIPEGQEGWSQAGVSENYNLTPDNPYYRKPRPSNRPVRLAVTEIPNDRAVAANFNNKTRVDSTGSWPKIDRWLGSQGATHSVDTEEAPLRPYSDSPKMTPTEIAQTAHAAQRLKSLIKSLETIIDRL
jgi:hypothetical protein